MPEQPQMNRRATDPNVLRLTRLVKVIAALLLVVVLISTVASIVAVVSARSAQHAVDRAEKNSATIADLCQIARRQRSELTSSLQNTKDYLGSPVANENPGFTAYIRAVSLPQIRAKVKHERVPLSCRKNP